VLVPCAASHGKLSQYPLDLGHTDGWIRSENDPPAANEYSLDRYLDTEERHELMLLGYETGR
jgi:hypothetical protein